MTKQEAGGLADAVAADPGLPKNVDTLHRKDHTFRTVATEELVRLLDDPLIAIIDVRPIAAYNGWRLQHEKRGGHIPGAMACPQTWIETLDSSQVRLLLEGKGATIEKTIIVYSYDGPMAIATATQLEQAGYRHVMIYPEGFPAWAAEPRFPVERLPRFERLVHAHWVKDLIFTHEAEEYDGNPYVVGHVTSNSPQEYQHQHIPGALHIDTNLLEDSNNWNRRSPAELWQALTAYGISHDTTVVLYGDDHVPRQGQLAATRGQIAAARAASIMMYAGVEDVRLLDGGLSAWRAGGYEMESGWQEPHSIQEFGAQVPSHPEYFINMEEVRNMLANRSGLLVSVRSWSEFIGNTSGYPYIKPRGRIAGSVWGNWLKESDFTHNYRNPDNTMREFHEIAANWQKSGINCSKRVVFYCGTGWRASEAFFYAYLLGWPKVAIYDGGWFEWSLDPANPVETGLPD